MRNALLCDTSSLIVLSKINELDLLNKMYDEVIITHEISSEYGKGLPNWINIIEVKDSAFKEYLSIVLDMGEASLIALSKEIEYYVISLDDLKARQVAKTLNLRITGTLGLISKAKKMGLITQVKPILNKIRDTNFHISDSLLIEFLKIHKEY